MENSKLKVALAFSGASSRSVFYIGFLEVLQENNFPIDFIASISGASIVAGSYACGSMSQLKEQALALDKEFLSSLIERSQTNGGLYNLHKVEEYLRVFTRNKNFEDITPKLAIIATDINSGEEVDLQYGDIAKAICASSTLPGIFEPVEWGNKALVDGGILSIVPGSVCQTAGADVIIGIDLRATRHVFSKWQIMLKSWINTVRSILWPGPLRTLHEKLSNFITDSDFFSSYHSLDGSVVKNNRNLFGVLGKALDLAIKAQQEHDPETNFNCDLLIVPPAPKISFWKKYFFLHFTDFGKTKDYYDLGRSTALKFLPQMWQLLSDKQIILKHNDQKLQVIKENL